MMTGSTPLAAWTMLLALSATTCEELPQRTQDPQPRQEYLQAATGIANWLRTHETRTETGLRWPNTPEASPESSIALYHGNSGVVLFLLGMHNSAVEQVEKDRYLADARLAADGLIARLPQPGTNDAIDSGLYTGIAGVGFTLTQVARVTGDEKYKRAAVHCLEVVNQQATKTSTDSDSNSAAWNNSTDIISGTAGIGLYLLDAHKSLEDQDALQLARQAGNSLLALAQETEAGLSWKMSPDYPRDMPNFSHGTAGVAYFLCQLGQETGEQKYLNAAIRGAKHLLAIADREHGGLCIFHHAPGGEDLFYLGWCHGPPGTARLFYALAQATGDDEWHTYVHSAAASIMQSGIPAESTPGFWNNHGSCCGTAGVAEFFLELVHAYEKTEYHAFSQKLVSELLSSANPQIVDGAHHLNWRHAEHRVQPDNLSTHTGYMQGAAGIGLTLLRMHAAEHQQTPPIRLPDSPFED